MIFKRLTETIVFLLWFAPDISFDLYPKGNLIAGNPKATCEKTLKYMVLPMWSPESGCFCTTG